MADEREREHEDDEYQTAYERLHDDDANDELALDEDESLPWLESSEYADSQGNDSSRMIGFVLLGMIALGILLGSIWYFTRPKPDPELAGDGGTIEAPGGDYKARPQNAGGKEFSNTGDVAPVVGQGKTREGRIAEKGTPTQTPTGGQASPAPKTSETPAASSGGVGVQVGAFSTKALAERGWQNLNGQTEKLSGVSHRVVEGTVDNGTVYRLQAVAGSRDAANTLCQALKADGVACQVK